MKRFFILVALAASMAVPGRAAIWYVATNGLDAAAGTNWATAKQTIQAAVDAASPGDTVVVSNGVYNTGGRAVQGASRNRIVVTNQVTVRSINGPAVTFIEGQPDPDPFTNDSYRGAFLGAQSTLAGFTITNGFVSSRNSLFDDYGNAGGGVFALGSATISNCVITGCSGRRYGGGVKGGSLVDCIVRANTAIEEGGGVHSVTADRCLIERNSSSYYGGGAASSTMRCSVLAYNFAIGGVPDCGAGAANCLLFNCTVYGNWITAGGSGTLGGVLGGRIVNSVVVSNQSGNHAQAEVVASCTDPAPAGAGNITNRPVFVDAGQTNFHLAAASPGIDMGSNELVQTTLDFDRNPRVVNGRVDMGAFEDPVSASAPVVDNGSGASDILANTATLHGTLLVSGGTATEVRIYWGLSDGGTNFGAWSNVCPFGLRSNGPVSTNISGLTAETRYYYRTWASNPVASVWAPATTSFVAVLPLAVLPQGLDFGPVTTGLVHELAFTVTNRGVVALTGDVRVVGAGYLLPGPTNFTLQSGGFLTVSVQFRPESPQPYAGAAIFQSDGGSVTNALTGEGFARTVWHVAPGGSDALAGTNWSTAKATIQAAIDIARSNDIVLVSNGVYATGSRVVIGSLPNRVSITGAIAVVSVNGPAFTTIAGEPPAYGPPVDGVRGAYVASNGLLAGFTVTNGYASDVFGEGADWCGGGVYCETGGAISNCVLTGNSALRRGGGLHGGVARSSMLVGNTSSLEGGGAALAGLFDCLLLSNVCEHGAGAFDSSLERCVLRGNDAGLGFGGGAFFGELRNCLLVLNRAGNGGGANSAYLLNCTVASNTATSEGGGTFSSTLVNSIVYGNVGTSGFNGVTNTVEYSCTEVLPTNGTGNIANDPEFLNAASGDYRLKATSRAIGRGNPALAAGAVDVEGKPRTVSGSVDMGAYQYQEPAGYWAWIAAATNGQTDIAQSASGDGYANLLKYATGGNPTNADHMARISHSATGGLLTLSFNRNTNAYDVTILVEGGHSMANGAAWKPIATNFNGSWGGATNVTEGASGNPVDVSVRDAPTGTSNRFLRLRITRP